MNGFVARASHFVAHPFGIHFFGAATPAGANPNRSSTLPTSAHPGADDDLSWLSLEEAEPETKDRSADLSWLSLEAPGPDEHESRENLTWLGLEEDPHRGSSERAL
jgi:hypothetical protein